MEMLIDDLTQLPDSFKDGVRGILLLQRNKDGETGNAQRKSIKLISNGINDWNDKIDQLHHLQRNSHPNHRIYSSVNSRCLKSAIHEFKHRQLDADLADKKSYDEFYIDIKNRFFSALMNPKSRNESFFLIDCDTPQEYSDAFYKVKDLIVFDYATKNGRHIITKPFNPNEIKVEIKKDDLIYIG